MGAPKYNVAIETSARQGSVTLARGDDLRGSAILPQPHRHSVELTTALAALLAEHGAGPTDLAEVYVSIGPGSFTGLRIAVATAKMLSQALGVRIAAVPTLDVLAQNVPPNADRHLAVCLNRKANSVYAGIYGVRDDQWTASDEPSLMTMAELLTVAPRPLMILGDPLPALPDSVQHVTVLPADLATPRSEAVWKLGRRLASHGQWTDALTLTPLYARVPEAVTLWDKRHGAPAR